MSIVTAVAFAGLLASAAMLLVRMVRGPSLADRIVALDTIVSVLVGGIAVGAVARGSGIFLDALVVTALLGFVGTVTVARYIERRGAR